MNIFLLFFFGKNINSLQRKNAQINKQIPLLIVFI